MPMMDVSVLLARIFPGCSSPPSGRAWHPASHRHVNASSFLSWPLAWAATRVGKEDGDGPVTNCTSLSPYWFKKSKQRRMLEVVSEDSQEIRLHRYRLERGLLIANALTKATTMLQLIGQFRTTSTILHYDMHSFSTVKQA